MPLIGHRLIKEYRKQNDHAEKFSGSREEGQRSWDTGPYTMMIRSFPLGGAERGLQGSDIGTDGNLSTTYEFLILRSVLLDVPRTSGEDCRSAYN